MMWIGRTHADFISVSVAESIMLGLGRPCFKKILLGETNKMPEKMSEYMPDRLPERTRKRMKEIERVSDRMSEYMCHKYFQMVCLQLCQNRV